MLLSRLQTCLKNLQRGKSDVSRAQPSLIHKTDLSCASPLLRPSEADRGTATAAAQQDVQGPQSHQLPSSSISTAPTSTALLAPGAGIAHLWLCTFTAIHSSSFSLDNFLNLCVFWSCKWFLWFALCWQHVQRSRLLIHWSAINSSLTQTGH